jgi:hypothetical protein
VKQLEEPLDVSKLDLDPDNPRLPEDVQGGSQADVLTYLYENDVLEELVDSFVANGYFESEPLIVLPEKDGRRVVVEGNRRLGALMILHQLPAAVDADIPLNLSEEPTSESLSKLRFVPGVEAANPDDVDSFLGFRHISGLKKWGPEAKARWLYKQVERRVGQQSDRGIFYDVGRQVGSNARGVRSAYMAYALLRHARDVLGAPAPLIDYVSKERFGVWTRLLGTANVTRRIGMPDKIAADYGTLRAQIEEVNEGELSGILQDLTPPSDKARPILGDSRDVTNYSDVLANDRAVSAMREFRSLSLAVEIVQQGELSDRLREMTRSVEVLTLDVRRYEVGEEEIALADEFAASARSLRGAIAATVAEDA